MSVRPTNTSNVALYDSVTGIAFGATFETEEDAEDFLQYAAATDGTDLRLMTPLQLATLRHKWDESRL